MYTEWETAVGMTETQAAIGITVLVILSILILCSGAIIMGIMTHRLAKRKGYGGYFWTGFFFHVIGLIYVVGLPDNRFTGNGYVNNGYANNGYDINSGEY